MQEGLTLQHRKLFNEKIDRFKKENLLSKKLTHRLKFVNTKTPKLYILPDIHKENNPRRLVIDSINCHSSGILRSVDHHLEPPVRKIPFYIKDANAGAFEGETPSSQAFEGSNYYNSKLFHYFWNKIFDVKFFILENVIPPLSLIYQTRASFFWPTKYRQRKISTC